MTVNAVSNIGSSVNLTVSDKGVLIKRLELARYTTNPGTAIYFYIDSSISTITIDASVGTSACRVMPDNAFITLPTGGSSYNFRTAHPNTTYLWLYSSGFNQSEVSFTNFKLK